MNNRIVALIALLLSLTSLAPGQSVDSVRMIYNRIKLDTRPFDAVKERWEVKDQGLIREVLVQILNRAALAREEVDTIKTQIQNLIESNNAGRLTILCTKRMVDDELESVQFVATASPKKTLGTLRDYILIEDALGDNVYRRLRDFPRIEYVPDQFDSKQRNLCDIYLHPLNPEITLWSTVSRLSDQRPTDYGMYRVSAFGRMGNDYLALPFWYKGSMIAAIRVSYIDSISIFEKVDRNYTAYDVSVGIDEPINFSVPGVPSTSPNSLFKQRRLEGSGTAIFLRGSIAPWHSLQIVSGRQQEHLRINVEAGIALQHKERYALDIPDTFYSVRNYATLSVYLQHAGMFNFGAGVSWHDVYHLSRSVPPGSSAILVEPSTNNFLPFVDVGIARDGELLQFALSTQINYNATLRYGFFVVKSSIMVSNTIGFDLRYFKAVQTSNLPPWQYGSYIVLTPVLRINY